MKSCEGCRFCQMSWDMRYLWKCKLMPWKRFDKPKWHGWFCEERVEDNKYGKNQSRS